MKMKVSVMLAALSLLTSVSMAQDLPKKVEDIDIFTLKNEPTRIPHFGEKNLMIFYVDPQAHKQNEAFTYELEETHRAEGPNIVGFGILNLKDAWYPNGLVRKMARKRTEKNGALVLADPKHLLRDAWDLGDCNDKFVLLIVSKEGELVFMRKGEFSEQDKADFFEVVEKYK